MKTLIPLSILALSPFTIILAYPILSPLPNRRSTVALHARDNVTMLPNGAGVARAGSVLNAAAAEEANPRDNTATRAFSSTSIKAANRQCLSIDPAAGDFRQNLIPVQFKACDGSAGEKFDIITKGKHNDQSGTMLVVSTLVCMNAPVLSSHFLIFLSPLEFRSKLKSLGLMFTGIADAGVPKL